MRPLPGRPQLVHSERVHAPSWCRQREASAYVGKKKRGPPYAADVYVEFIGDLPQRSGAGASWERVVELAFDRNQRSA
jgi:hypothetical protein